MDNEDIRDRVKKVREYLNLSQSAFGSKLSLERSAISLIERKQRNITERSVRDICREFRIDETWLREGGSEDIIFDVPLVPDNETNELASYCGEICAGKDPLIANALLTYKNLDEEFKQGIREYVTKLAEKIMETKQE